MIHTCRGLAIASFPGLSTVQFLSLTVCKIEAEGLTTGTQGVDMEGWCPTIVNHKLYVDQSTEQAAVLTFSGFSVGCCIERRLSVTNLSLENNFSENNFSELKLVTDNLLSSCIDTVF